MLINDKLQEAYDYSAYTITRDIVLLFTVYITYTYLPFDTFTSIWKLYLGVLLIRYILSELTVLRREDTNKKYFQMSGHMALFTLSVLFAAKQNIFNLQNALFRNAVLLTYAILNVVVHAHFTTDIVNTTIFVHFLFYTFGSYLN